MRKNPPVAVPPGHRYCFTCSTLKALPEFYRNRRTRDGHCANCKDCTHRTGRNYQQAKRPRSPMIARMMGISLAVQEAAARSAHQGEPPES